MAVLFVVVTIFPTLLAVISYTHIHNQAVKEKGEY